MTALKPLLLALTVALPLPSLADVLIPGVPYQSIAPFYGQGVPFAGQWRLDAVLQHGEPSPFAPDVLARVDLRIDARGHVTGSNGCNRLMFQIEPRIGRGWYVDGIASTRMLCHGDAAELERQVMAALNDGSRYVLAAGGQILQIYDNNETLRLSLRRAG